MVTAETIRGKVDRLRRLHRLLIEAAGRLRGRLLDTLAELAGGGAEGPADLAEDVLEDVQVLKAKADSLMREIDQDWRRLQAERHRRIAAAPEANRPRLIRRAMRENVVLAKELREIGEATARLGSEALLGASQASRPTPSAN